MSSLLKTLSVVLIVAGAVPGFAQPAPPPAPPAAPVPPPVRHRMLLPADRPVAAQHFGRSTLFAGMSPQGQEIMREAMKARRPTAAESAALRAARQKVLGLVAAEKLDMGAIRRAQAEEREAAMRLHARHQEALLAAYQKLSLGDRRAFVDGMRNREERTLDAIRKARQRLDDMERRSHERATTGMGNAEPTHLAQQR